MVKSPTSSKLFIGLGLIGIILAFIWPVIEENVITGGEGCPWPFSILHSFYTPLTSSEPSSDSSGITSSTEAGESGKVSTREEGTLRLSLEEMLRYEVYTLLLHS